MWQVSQGGTFFHSDGWRQGEPHVHKHGQHEHKSCQLPNNLCSLPEAYPVSSVLWSSLFLDLTSSRKGCDLIQQITGLYTQIIIAVSTLSRQNLSTLIPSRWMQRKSNWNRSLERKRWLLHLQTVGHMSHRWYEDQHATGTNQGEKRAAVPNEQTESSKKRPP